MISNEKRNKFLPKFFTHDEVKNCHIEFTANGCVVWVSLNISKEMSKYLYEGNIYQGKKMLVYALKKEITNVNTKTIKATYDILITNCMINHRQAKIKVLENEVVHLLN